MSFHVARPGVGQGSGQCYLVGRHPGGSSVFKGNKSLLLKSHQEKQDRVSASADLVGQHFSMPGTPHTLLTSFVSHHVAFAKTDTLGLAQVSIQGLSWDGNRRTDPIRTNSIEVSRRCGLHISRAFSRCWTDPCNVHEVR